MTAVSDVWEVQVWKPHLARAVAALPKPLTDEARDDAVFASLDVLPVPVLEFAYEPETGRQIDLGWVGESLVRLEAAGRLSSLRVAGREVWMRRGVASAHGGAVHGQEQRRSEGCR